MLAGGITGSDGGDGGVKEVEAGEEVGEIGAGGVTAGVGDDGASGPPLITWPGTGKGADGSDEISGLFEETCCGPGRGLLFRF